MNAHQLALARQVHYAFLPESYADDSLKVTVTAEPHGDLGGDYCGIVPLPDGKLALTVCDATGHDVASALFAARINTYVLSRMARSPKPCELVESLNHFLATRMGDTNMHATFCLALLDTAEGLWEFVGAGHPPAIHYRAASQDTVLVMSQTVMLGISESLHLPCSPTHTEFAPGDKILLMTDGLMDARDEKGALFGLDRLCALVVENAGSSGLAFNETLFAAARAHGDGDLGDDALLVTAERR